MFLISKDFFEIKNTKEKGRGVFAVKKIEKGTLIGDYLGKVIKIVEYDLNKDAEGLYLMFLNDEAAIYPDLKKTDIHLINHSCEPNCWIYLYHGHTLFFAIKNIKAKEELTISYLLSPNEKCDPCTHTCKCGSKKCSGTMHLTESKHKKWQKFQDKYFDKKLREKLVFGKNLLKLKSYPIIKESDPIYEAVKFLTN